MGTLLIHLGIFIIGAVAGFLFGMFFYRNNKRQMSEMLNTVEDLKNQLKRKKRK